MAVNVAKLFDIFQALFRQHGLIPPGPPLSEFELLANRDISEVGLISC